MTPKQKQLLFDTTARRDQWRLSGGPGAACCERQEEPILPMAMVLAQALRVSARENRTLYPSQ